MWLRYKLIFIKCVTGKWTWKNFAVLSLHKLTLGQTRPTSTTSLSVCLYSSTLCITLPFLFQLFKLDAGVDVGVSAGVGLGEAWD